MAQAGEQYLYDAAGNLTRGRDGENYAFDGENKMTSFNGGGSQGGADYSYDGDGRRVKKVVGTATTVFVYDVFGRLVAEYSTSPEPNGTKYFISDHLGSPRVITDANGAVKSRHDYLPFGQELFAGAGGRATEQGYVGDNVRQKFTQYERDSETDLDYAQARYYSHLQGRFSSPDPLLTSGTPAEPQSFNRYSYCLNNPLRYVDPTGLKWGIQHGYNSAGERIAIFQWFDGDVDESTGFKLYDKSYYVGKDELLWLDSGSNAHLKLAKENFSDDEFASLQGADPSSFSNQQRETINREIADWFAGTTKFAVQKAIAGGVGGLAGGVGGFRFTFGAAERYAARVPPVLFHYTNDGLTATINATQLGGRGGPLFLTNSGNLSPAMARELLALPPGHYANALYAVDAQALRAVPLLERGAVQAANGRLGGGFQFVFNGTAPRGSYVRFRF